MRINHLCIIAIQVTQCMTIKATRLQCLQCLKRRCSFHGSTYSNCNLLCGATHLLKSHIIHFLLYRPASLFKEASACSFVETMEIPWLMNATRNITWILSSCLCLESLKNANGKIWFVLKINSVDYLIFRPSTILNSVSVYLIVVPLISSKGAKNETWKYHFI